jgi:branched-chain amino acid transport system substrate-binding protein
VLISPASTNPQITQAGDYVFRVIPSDSFRGAQFANYVRTKANFEKVSILYINNDGGVGAKTAFSEAYKGKLVSVESYPPEATDLRPQITKIIRARPEAVILISYPDDTPLALRQIRELGLRCPVFSLSEALDDPAVVRRAGRAAEGVVYILASKATSDAAQQFQKSYRDRYKREPELFAPEAFDVIHLVASILSSTDDPLHVTPDVLKQRLYATKGYQGASGVISFDKNGDVEKPMDIRRIEAGQSKFVEKIDPSNMQ